MSRLLPPSTPQFNGRRRRVSNPQPSAGLSREELLKPEDPVEGFFTREQWHAVGSALQLSPRELAVTMLLAQGTSRQSIGHHLRKADGSCVSADTVRVYIDRVFRKARVGDRQGLILRLARAYLLLNGCNRQDRPSADG